jgi:Mce-associated membrane protein
MTARAAEPGPDAGRPDATVTDATVTDATVTDATVTDATVTDATVTDDGVPDAADGTTPVSADPAEVSPRARRLLVALAGLVVVSAVVVGWFGWQAYSTAQDRHAQDEALAAARSATAQVLSYSAPTLDADLARSRSMISGLFAAKFAQLADNVIVPAVKEQNLATKAVVLNAAVIDAQPDQVRALLFVNQTSTMTGAPEPRTAANQVRVTMTAVDGQWLISDLQPL